MKRNFFNLHDLRDSREFYESKPKPIGVFFTYILIALLIAGIVFSFYGKKEVILKTTADIQYTKPNSNVTNEVAGKVKTVAFKQVDKVKKGDTLLTLDNSEIQAQKKAAKATIKDLKEQVELNKTLKKSIEKDKNLFSEDDNWGYQDQYLSYKKQINLLKSSEENAKNQQNKLEKQKKNVKSSLNKTKNNVTLKIQRISALQDSIKNNKSFAKQDDKYSSYYNSYRTNKQNVEQQLVDLEKMKDELDKNTFSQQKENLSGQLDSLKQDMLVKLSEEKDELNQSLDEINSSIESDDFDSDSTNSEQTNYELSIEQLKTNLLNQTSQKQTDLQTTLKSKEDDLKMIDLQLEKYKIKAASDGYVNVLTNISPGDNLQAGTAILTIIPDKEKLKANIYIPSHEITNINEKDEVRIHIENTNQTIKGVITNISPDSISDQKGQKFYIAESTIANNEIVKDNGVKIHLKNGMQTNVSIIVDSKRYIDYFLDVLHLH
ncbi:HlyD family efflux transporter periplasmic adaptor subunit [Bacillus vallismortis]|uniref:HlyD family efflux transporter periplasmic adaptor subunit n=1 Tax=Bacillus vallismortis TaxID=72361 RepID=A0AAP3CN99_BACVA|nr:HlyD family efflux transporter periplasmic adaptor subunit [Bacillus vallismortis]MCY8318160.1 HlyD family efflux transporter periplasmic adaptor subunit [Bacillus vallismortis]MEC1650290.1 HlyD family efflux transporter periplasmic adaptor subunit [Bacillus vallismortis]